MKKFLLSFCLLALAVPCSTLAMRQPPGNNPPPKHHKGAAPEMPGVAFGAAAAVGVAGYLLLRRRHTHQN